MLKNTYIVNKSGALTKGLTMLDLGYISGYDLRHHMDYFDSQFMSGAQIKLRNVQLYFELSRNTEPKWNESSIAACESISF